MNKQVKDLTNRVFGRLTVIRYVDIGANRSARWLCRCECGGEKIASADKLSTGATRSCGCLRFDKAHTRTIDLTGRVFGRLTVISFSGYTGSNNRALWLCQCECGRKKVIASANLTKSKLPTISCGCRRPGRTENLIGLVVGYLTVIGREGFIDGHSAWRVRCICGKEKVKPARDIKSGLTKSCGCRKGEMIAQHHRKATQDLTGQVFDRLTAIRIDHYVGPQGRGTKGVRWLCRCKCGNEKVVAAQHLKNGATTSCGCKRQGETHPGFKWPGYKQITGRQWQKVLQGAASRKLPVTITIEDAWSVWEQQAGKCNLSGVEITLHAYGQRPYTASLDRIDSARGYEPDNIQWVHKTVNRMKTDLEQAHFINLCRLIAERNHDG